MQASDIKRLRELEEENRKLKQMYAEFVSGPFEKATKDHAQ